MSVLVVDVGTTGLRAAVVRDDASITGFTYEPLPPSSPFAGLVEFDGVAMRDAVLRVAKAALQHAGTVRAVGITAQRASTIVWDSRTGNPVAPGLGWQDLRTVGDCISLRTEKNLVFAPNQTATKLKWFIANVEAARSPHARAGTVDTWVAAVLSNFDVHATDSSNAAVTGLADHASLVKHEWSRSVLDALDIDPALLPRIVPTMSHIGVASALPGSPPIFAMVGDQQSSLVGQGGIVTGAAKATFGTGGMLDMYAGTETPKHLARTQRGTFPIVVYSQGDTLHWGSEAIMLTAGTNVEWLVNDMGLIPDASSSDAIAATVASSDGVMYVPALIGMGTPQWDYGARGTLLGLTRGTSKSHVVRAVLEGIAHRGADLLEASESDTGLRVDRLRVDGGMSRNHVFVQALADATGRPVDVCRETEATTLGAAFLAGVGAGVWRDLTEAASLVSPLRTVEPRDATSETSGTTSIPSTRAQWHEAVRRARGWIPELSALDF
ncbi:MAG: FGGY family carbohydrate kinase [Actinomycetota bacterium]